MSFLSIDEPITPNVATDDPSADTHESEESVETPKLIKESSSDDFKEIALPPKPKNLTETPKTLKNFSSGRATLFSVDRVFSSFRESLHNFIFRMNRPQWSSQFHFYCVNGCMMIGAGDLLLFPIAISKYGVVSFIVAYFTSLVFVGYPLLLIQTGLGQFTSKGPGDCWEFAILFKGIGYAMIFNMVVTGAAYMNNLVHIIRIQFEYYSKQQSISEAYKDAMHFKETNFTDIRDIFNINKFYDPNNTIFLENNVIPSFFINWALICIHLLLSTSTRGKTSSIIFTLYYTVIIGFTIHSLTLTGAWSGIEFAFRDTSVDLLRLDLWNDAFKQCMFSLNLYAPGIHMTIASFNHFHNLIPWDTLLLIVMDTCMSLVGIFFTYSLLGHLSATSDFQLEHFDTVSANELISVLLPSALEKSENGIVWVVIYFAIFTLLFHVCTTINYAIIIQGVIDILRLTNNYELTVLLTSFFTILSTSLICTIFSDSFMHIIHNYAVLIGPILIILLLLPITYVYGVERIMACFECSVGWETTWMFSNYYWKSWLEISWKYLCPVYCFLFVVRMTILIHFYDDHQKELLGIHHDEHDEVSGWTMWSFTALLIFSPMVYLMIVTDKGDFLDRLTYLCRPSAKWGPLLEHHKHMMRIGEEDVRMRKRRGYSRKASTYEELSRIMMRANSYFR